MKQTYYIPGTNIPNPQVDSLAYTMYMTNKYGATISSYAQNLHKSFIQSAFQAGQADYYNAKQKQKEEQAKETEDEAKRYNNYDDAKQLNSIADYLFNWGKDISFSDRVKGLGEHMVNDVWGNLLGFKVDDKGLDTSPKANPSAAFNNLLVEIGDDTNVFASTVKAITTPITNPAQENADVIDNLKSVVGLGADKGARKNFDYKTGHGVLDFGLELVSDPVDWVSFGAAGLIKTGAKDALDTVTKVATRRIATELDTDVAKQIIEDTNKTILHTSINDIKAGTLDPEKLINNLNTQFITNAAKGTVSGRYTAGFKIYTDTLRETLADNLVTDSMRNAGLLYRGANQIQLTALKIGVSTSPILPVAIVTKYIANQHPVNMMRVMTKINQVVTKTNDNLKPYNASLSETTLSKMQELAHESLPIDELNTFYDTCNKDLDCYSVANAVLIKQQTENYLSDTDKWLQELYHARAVQDESAHDVLTQTFLNCQGSKDIDTYLNSVQQLVNKNMDSEYYDKLSRLERTAREELTIPIDKSVKYSTVPIVDEPIKHTISKPDVIQPLYKEDILKLKDAITNKTLLRGENKDLLYDFATAIDHGKFGELNKQPTELSATLNAVQFLSDSQNTLNKCRDYFDNNFETKQLIDNIQTKMNEYKANSDYYATRIDSMQKIVDKNKGKGDIYVSGLRRLDELKATKASIDQEADVFYKTQMENSMHSDKIRSYSFVNADYQKTLAEVKTAKKRISTYQDQLMSALDSYKAPRMKKRVIRDEVKATLGKNFDVQNNLLIHLQHDYDPETFMPVWEQNKKHLKDLYDDVRLCFKDQEVSGLEVDFDTMFHQLADLLKAKEPDEIIKAYDYASRYTFPEVKKIIYALKHMDVQHIQNSELLQELEFRNKFIKPTDRIQRESTELNLAGSIQRAAEKLQAWDKPSEKDLKEIYDVFDNAFQAALLSDSFKYDKDMLTKEYAAFKSLQSPADLLNYSPETLDYIAKQLIVIDTRAAEQSGELLSRSEILQNLITHLEDSFDQTTDNLYRTKIHGPAGNIQVTDNLMVYAAKFSERERTERFFDAMDITQRAPQAVNDLNNLAKTGVTGTEEAVTHIKQCYAFQTLIDEIKHSPKVGNSTIYEQTTRQAIDCLCNYHDVTIARLSGINRHEYMDTLMHNIIHFETPEAIPQEWYADVKQAVQKYIDTCHLVDPTLAFTPSVGRLKDVLDDINLEVKHLGNYQYADALGESHAVGMPSALSDLRTAIGGTFYNLSQDYKYMFKDRYLIQQGRQVYTVTGKWITLPQQYNHIFPYVKDMAQGMISMKTAVKSKTFEKFFDLTKPYDLHTLEAMQYIGIRLSNIDLNDHIITRYLADNPNFFNTYDKTISTLKPYLTEHKLISKAESAFQPTDVKTSYLIARRLWLRLCNAQQDGIISPEDYMVLAKKVMDEGCDQKHFDILNDIRYLQNTEYNAERADWNLNKNIEPSPDAITDDFKTLEQYSKLIDNLNVAEHTPDDLLDFISEFEGPKGATDTSIANLHSVFQNDSGLREYNQTALEELDKAHKLTKKSIYELQVQKTIEANDSLVNHIISYPPAQLHSFLSNDVPGFICFKTSENQIEPLTKLIEHKDEYEKLGMVIRSYNDDVDNEIMVIGLGRNELLSTPSLGTTDVLQIKPLTWLHDHEFIQGSVITPRLLREETVHNVFNKFPAELQNLLRTPDQFKAEGFFTTARYDAMLFGEPNFLRIYNQYIPTDLPRQITILHSRVLQNASLKETAAYVFDSDVSRLSYNALFSNCKINNVVDAFRNNKDTVGLYYVTDKKGIRRAEVIELTTPQACRIAKKINPVIINRTEAIKIMKVFNTKSATTNWTLSMLDTAISILKAGYLSSMGWVANNVTSSVLKAVIGSDIDYAELPERMNFMHNSFRIMHKYKNCFNALHEYSFEELYTKPSKFNTLWSDVPEFQVRVPELTPVFNKDTLNRFFKEHPEWSDFEEVFKDISEWQRHGPTSITQAELNALESNGLIYGTTLRKSLKNIQVRMQRKYPQLFDDAGNVLKEHEATYLNLKAQQIAKDVAWKNPWTGKLTSLNSDIEQYLRYDSYRWERVKHDASFSKATQTVSDIHFDYDNMGEATRKLEYVLPFVNFKINNLKFWMDKMFTDPRLVHMYMSYMRANDALDQDQETTMNEQAYMNYLRMGSVAIPHTNRLFKINFDMATALETALNPIDTIQNSVIVYKTWKQISDYNKALDDLTVKFHLASNIAQMNTNTDEKYLTKPAELAKLGTQYQKQVDYYNQKKNQAWWNAIPFVGAMRNRLVQIQQGLANDGIVADEFTAINNTAVEGIIQSVGINSQTLDRLMDVVPSLFTTHDKKYYYSFGNSNYATKDIAVYMKALSDNARQGWSGVSQEVQERKRYYAFTFANSGDYFFTSNPDTAVKMANKGAIALNDEMQNLTDEMDIVAQSYHYQSRKIYQAPVHVKAPAHSLNWGYHKKAYAPSPYKYKATTPYKYASDINAVYWKMHTNSINYYQTRRSIQNWYNQRTYRSIVPRMLQNKTSRY